MAVKRQKLAPAPLYEGLPIVQALKVDPALEQAFPSVNSGVRPCGSFVLVQIRTAKRKTAGGIILTDDAKDTEKWNTQVGKVISLGPIAFRNRSTGEPWPEGNWVNPGDYVRVPKYGGDRWEVPTNQPDEPALFVIFNDLDIRGVVTGDPLTMKAFI